MLFFLILSLFTQERGLNHWSRNWWRFVHSRVIDVLRDYKSPYEDNRNLAALRGTKMPAILTETGIISNSSDFKYLKSSSGQDEIANKIYRGVKDWWFV
ncbi:N-acetylmuramoyl-L-alanine amidase family protein [Brevibacillus laterosporus]|uniref:N-acetylmuramoyl-L-alanine amidase family protein n=1 Tax=Brevibacillus laterosporus TaxID=1465 RepID=UPI0015E2563D|nr:N-acetylmuramoyl-L-alanine amidase [Brevibacillus laterosporus]